MTPPTRYALVPVDITPEMEAAVMREKGVPYWEWRFQNNYTAMLAASPNGGAVTVQQLDDTAKAVLFDFFGVTEEAPGARLAIKAEITFILDRLGLPVADAPAGEVVDG